MVWFRCEDVVGGRSPSEVSTWGILFIFEVLHPSHRCLAPLQKEFVPIGDSSHMIGTYRRFLSRPWYSSYSIYAHLVPTDS